MTVSRRQLISQIGLGAGLSVVSPEETLPAALPVHNVGLAIDAARFSVPLDATVLQTTGYARAGIGAALYAFNAAAKGEAAAGRLIIADHRCFDLLPTQGSVSPQMFGALSDYDPVTGIGTDDSEAFRSCLSFCMARPKDRAWPMEIYGHYLLTRNDMLGDQAHSFRGKQGFVIRGHGTASSNITWRPDAQVGVNEYFFRDGLAKMGKASISNVLLDFELIGFTLYLDARNLQTGQTLGGFRMSGWNIDPAPEQAWAWRDFRIQGDAAHLRRNGPALRIVGDANGSEVSLIRCAGQYLSAAIMCSNAQAVNHSVVSSNFELMTGSTFDYVRGGGLTVISGSYIVDDFDRHVDGLGSDIYLLKVGGDGTGQINDFLIAGIRIELRSIHAKVFRGGDMNTASNIRLCQVNCGAVVGGFRRTFEIAESALSITIDGGSWTSPPGYAEPIAIHFLQGPDTAYVHRGGGPRVLLTGGVRVSPTIHDLVAWSNDASTGHVQVGHDAVCGPTQGLAGEAGYAAPDIHLAATLTNPAGKGFVPKGTMGRCRRSWSVNFYAWPGTRARQETARFMLPPGAILLGARAIRNMAPGPHEPAQLAIVDDADGSVVGAFDEVPDFASGFDVRTPNLYHVVSHGRRTFCLVNQSARDSGLRQTGAGDILLIDLLA